MRISFGEIFRIEAGHLFILRKVRIQGITIEPMEISGTTIGGIDWNLFRGQDLEVKIDDDSLVIKGIFK